MRHLYLNLIGLILLSLICSMPVNATHYLGGDMSYTYLGNNTYLITVRIYNDCHNGDAQAIAQDLPIYYSIFTGNGLRYSTDSVNGSFRLLS